MKTEGKRKVEFHQKTMTGRPACGIYYIVSVALHLSQKLCGFECFKVGWVLGHFQKEGRERERRSISTHLRPAVCQVSLPLQYRRVVNHIDQI